MGRWHQFLYPYVIHVRWIIILLFEKAKEPVPIINLKKIALSLLRATTHALKPDTTQGYKTLEHRHVSRNYFLIKNVAKLCDFGWSAICKDRRNTYCGTLDYVSPEIIEGDGYDDSVDIWCIGVLTYELLVGKTPFFNISRK